MTKQNELIVFTHNDLDALGTMLGIEYKFPNVQKKYFHTNYGNIKQRVQEIEDYVKENGNTHILITDVSFSDNKESLRKLYELGKCTHIDHHLYPDGFWDEFPDMKVVYDKTKCATLLCHEYFSNQGKNERLDKLVHIIDTYDLWKSTSPIFPVAQDLNNYFWTHDIGELTNKIVNNDFKLPDDFVIVVNDIKNTYTQAIKDYEANNMIHRQGEVTILFADEWFNQVHVQEMAKGQNVVIGISSYGIIRVRFNVNSPYSLEQKQKVRELLTGQSNIGHEDAFTYKCNKQSFDDLMAETQRVVSVLSEVL